MTDSNKEVMNVLTKEEYVLSRTEMVIKDYLKRGENINPSTLLELTEQWKFDYEAEKLYRPHVLKK